MLPNHWIHKHSHIWYYLSLIILSSKYKIPPGSFSMISLSPLNDIWTHLEAAFNAEFELRYITTYLKYEKNDVIEYQKYFIS